MGVADPADGAAGRSVATVPRLQDCRSRSVFEAGGPGSYLALAVTNRSTAAPQFYWGFLLAPLGDGPGRWRERGRMGRR